MPPDDPPGDPGDNEGGVGTAVEPGAGLADGGGTGAVVVGGAVAVGGAVDPDPEPVVPPAEGTGTGVVGAGVGRGTGTGSGLLEDPPEEGPMGTEIGPSVSPVLESATRFALAPVDAVSAVAVTAAVASRACTGDAGVVSEVA